MRSTTVWTSTSCRRWIANDNGKLIWCEASSNNVCVFITVLINLWANVIMMLLYSSANIHCDHYLASLSDTFAVTEARLRWHLICLMIDIDIWLCLIAACSRWCINFLVIHFWLLMEIPICLLISICHTRQEQPINAVNLIKIILEAVAECFQIPFD